MTVNELKRLLRNYGCYELSHGKEHDVWFSPVNEARIRIPRHQSVEVPRGTLFSILKQAGIR
ncbi:MAG: type II toxin-antitoxin system HicA family toxin [Bacteroidales bacterium]|nr:type II toxin-antitoxin system HicA family toxin [Bacteroidales bacterium]